MIKSNDKTKDNPFNDADAIIRMIDKDHWAFHTLGSLPEGSYPISGTYGDLYTVSLAAQYQFGGALLTQVHTSVRYDDPQFPIHLIPDENRHGRIHH